MFPCSQYNYMCDVYYAYDVCSIFWHLQVFVSAVIALALQKGKKV